MVGTLVSLLRVFFRDRRYAGTGVKAREKGSVIFRINYSDETIATVKVFLPLDSRVLLESLLNFPRR